MTRTFALITAVAVAAAVALLALEARTDFETAGHWSTASASVNPDTKDTPLGCHRVRVTFSRYGTEAFGCKLIKEVSGAGQDRAGPWDVKIVLRGWQCEMTLTVFGIS